MPNSYLSAFPEFNEDGIHPTKAHFMTVGYKEKKRGNVKIGITWKVYEKHILIVCASASWPTDSAHNSRRFFKDRKWTNPANAK